MELGLNGLGTTAPNPMVGCVIVNEDSIIAEGFTSPYGGPHAEVNAINSVKDSSLLLTSTLYVSLEPCSHYGKTPPCANLIIEKGIPEVVVGIMDPHDKVGGAGIKKLEKNGCRVTVGILEEECRKHHKRFLSFHEKERPYIILKWAESQDGFIAPSSSQREQNPEPYWITNAYSRQRVHQWRGEEQAILVGTNTVLEDNPSLTTRDWEGKNPVRVILDKDLKTPLDFQVLNREVKTIVITQNLEKSKHLDGVEYEAADFTQNLAKQVCEILYKHQINSVIIEGGARTLQTFIDENLWDEARVFEGAQSFGSGTSAPRVLGRPIKKEQIQSDYLTILVP